MIAKGTSPKGRPEASDGALDGKRAAEGRAHLRLLSGGRAGNGAAVREPAAERSTASRVLRADALGDHLDRLYRAALGMCRCPDDAEDLVQETYARVLARPRALRGDDDLAYLLRAMRNVHLNRLRAEGRRPQTVTIADELEPVDHAGEQTPQLAVEDAEVLDAVRSLPAHYRDALLAVDLVGLPYRDASRALRVRGGTLRSRLYRARRALAPMLDSSGAAGADRG